MFTVLLALGFSEITDFPGGLLSLQEQEDPEGSVVYFWDLGPGAGLDWARLSLALPRSR